MMAYSSRPKPPRYRLNAPTPVLAASHSATSAPRTTHTAATACNPRPRLRPLPTLTAEPLALESIYGNLITNALNYTQEGGEIRVKAELVCISIRVSVIDNGFGIEARHLDKIFERFYRVKDDNTRFITGTGLGLPIVKGLVDSLGGFIDVESTPGSGSVFMVTLPLKEAEGEGKLEKVI